MFTHHTVPMSVSNIIITKHNNDMRKLLLSLLCLFSALLVAQAADTPVYSVMFNLNSCYTPDKNTLQAPGGYTTDAKGIVKSKSDNRTYNTVGFNWNFQSSTTWNYLKCGSGNASDSSFGQITTGFAVEKPITSIVVKINSGSICLSALQTLSVFVDSSEKGAFTEKVAEITTLKSGNNTITLDSRVQNKYIRLYFQCKKAATKTNGSIWVDGLDFCESSLPTPTWSFAAPASLKLGEGFSVATGVQEGVNVTYSASRTGGSGSESTADLIKVVDGKIYPLVAGTLTVTASSAEVANAFAPKSESVTVNADKLPYPFGWVVNGAIQTGAVTCKNTQGPLQWANCSDYFYAQGIDVPTAVVDALNAKLPARSADATCTGDDVLSFNASDNSITIKSGAKGRNTVALSFPENDVATGGDCALDINVVDKDPTTWTFTSAETDLTIGEAFDFTLTPVDGQPSPTIEATDDVKVIDGKYYPTKAGEITLTATSAADDTMLQERFR